jgi:V/A-type H+-transporting ATPase subunit I
MLRAAPMRRVFLAVPRAALDEVVEAVGRLGVLHLLDLAEPDASTPAAEPAEDVRRNLRERLRRIEALGRFFALPAPALAAQEPAPEDWDRRVAEWTVEMEHLRAERTRLREELAALDRSLRSASSLARDGLDPSLLAEMRRLHASAGWLPARELERLEESLGHVPHRLVVLHGLAGERLVVAFCLPHDAAALDRALASSGFDAVVLPKEAAGSGRETEHVLRGLREHVVAQQAELEGRFEAGRGRLAEPLARARSATEHALALAEARSFASRSQSVAFLAGWVPARQVDALRQAVRAATGGRCYLRVDAPDSIDAVRAGREPVPILFRNPALMRPFERLVSSYGPPRWREIDPTPLVAVSFWVMFGIMFGDVGHGAVLAGIGWWLFRRRVRYRDYGVILMECGIASLLFGLAYGTVFGSERWLPALWFRPLQDVPRLLRVGAEFGLVFLALAFALGAVNAVLRRDWRGLLLGSNGLLVAIAYWIAAALALRWLASGRPGLSAELAALLVGAPLAVLWLSGAWSRTLRDRRPGVALLESSVELLDVVVRNVANTVSFVRLAAFAVSHAGLLLAVFTLAEMLSTSRFGGLAGTLVLVAGNVLVLVLEGLIVSIQTVRLVYYEFFSRFHEGAGLEYRPLRLRAQTGGQRV